MPLLMKSEVRIAGSAGDQGILAILVMGSSSLRVAGFLSRQVNQNFSQYVLTSLACMLFRGLPRSARLGKYTCSTPQVTINPQCQC